MTTGRQEALTQLRHLAETGTARFNQTDAMYVRAELDRLAEIRDQANTVLDDYRNHLAAAHAERDQLLVEVERLRAQVPSRAPTLDDLERPAEDYPGQRSVPERCPVCGGPVDVEHVDVTTRPDARAGRRPTIPMRWSCPEGCDPRERDGMTPDREGAR